jgi:hypothetical protein
VTSTSGDTVTQTNQVYVAYGKMGDHYHTSENGRFEVKLFPSFLSKRLSFTLERSVLRNLSIDWMSHPLPSGRREDVGG